MADAAAEEEGGPPPGVESVFLTGKYPKRGRPDVVVVCRLHEEQLSSKPLVSVSSKRPSLLCVSHVSSFAAQAPRSSLSGLRTWVRVSDHQTILYKLLPNLRWIVAPRFHFSFLVK